MKDKIVQAIKFFGISGIGWIIDVVIYCILSNFIYPWISNVISSFTSITFVFIVSTRKLFVNNKYSLKLKYIVYIVYQILLVSLSSFIIKLLIDWLGSLNVELIVNFANILAKIIVTPFTMILNFIVMKNLIEKI